MQLHRLFNVRDGVQYDMHLHGSYFIIVEFALAAVIETIVLLFSINYAFRLIDWPWWYWPWLVICAGMIPNSLAVCLVAWRIAQKEGNHPTRPGHPHSERDLWLFPLLVIIPLVLPLLAWVQRKQSNAGPR